LLGLALRLAFLPLAKNTEPDSISRIFAAWRWISQPEFITHGAWGPLHTYLIAIALKVMPDAAVAPALLSILFGVATAIPLYFLTKVQFSESGAPFVALAYLFYPVAVRNSLMAVSEIPFVFFAACAFLFVSVARRENGSSAQALLAGLFLTLAAALRYEAWVLIPLFAVFLLRKPKILLAFLVTSLSFPVFWMIGNLIYQGDPLAGVNAATHWQIDIEGVNENVSFRTILARVGFYPWNVFFGLTPIVAIMAIAGVVLCAVKDDKSRKLLLWLVPFLGLSIVFLVKAEGGSLLLRGRYSIILGMLILPFSSVFFERLRWKRLFMILIIATMIPFSFLFSRFPYLDETRAIPTFDTAQIDSVVKMIKQHNGDATGGLILDSLGWTNTYYLALMTGHHPNGIFMAPGGKYQALDSEAFSGFLESHRTGILVLWDGSRFAEKFAVKNSRAEFSPTSHGLSLEEAGRIDDIAVLRYELSDTVTAGRHPA
jgi:4-amino-4-deoxy-L-arabinose transferase-like glycosyltransferase